MEKSKNPDAAAVALLKWILAALLLVNGLALAVAISGGHEGLLAPARWNYVAGLLCALIGALCWAASRASNPKPGEEETDRAAPAPRGPRDQSVAFGAFGIMLWVASLTAFVTGLEHLSWAPGGDQKPVHPAPRGIETARR